MRNPLKAVRCYFQGHESEWTGYARPYYQTDPTATTTITIEYQQRCTVCGKKWWGWMRPDYLRWKETKL